MAHPELLADQLLAMVRLAQQTPVSVMFPMITTLDELFAARGLLDDGDRAGPVSGRPPGLQVGMMVEVPAAALKAAAFARHVDFLSIGTNDLTQYALAADRNNDAVASIGDTFDPGSPATDPSHLPGRGRSGVGIGVRRVRRRRAGRGSADRAWASTRCPSLPRPSRSRRKPSARWIAVDARALSEEVLSADSAAAVRERLA